MAKTLRGVNLGGWLVLERWMTPSLFAGTDAADEYTFMHTPDAKAKLKRHRDTFITEKDFKWLRDHGLNAVRLPVGYWLLEPDGPYEKGTHYVDWAFRMAEKYKLLVLLDLHGAPGSQNGHDHSGRTGEAAWFTDETARKRTIGVLQKLHARYKNSPSYWGIELLNEPKASWRNPLLQRFYKEAAGAITGNAKIIFHDGFRPRRLSGTLRHDGRAVMDSHLYHTTSWAARPLSARYFVKLAGWWWGRLLHRLSKRQPVIVGEWGVVLGGKKLQNMDESDALQLMRRYGKIQLTTYERQAAGWFYWNYRTEEQGLWNFRWLVENGFLELPR